MSRIRANKITDKLGTGSVELEKGAHLPVGMGITGAGNINLSGVITATTITATTFSGVDSTAIKDSGGNVKIQAQASGAVYTGIHTFTTLNSSTGTLSGDLDVDGHTNLDNLSVAGVATVTGNLNVGGVLTYEDVTNVDSVGVVTARAGINVSGGVITAQASQNKIPFLYNALTDLPNAGTYHGMFAHVHSTQRGYFAHGGGWYQLINKEANNIVGTGTETYNVGVLTATTLYGNGANLTGISVGITTEALVKTNGQTASLDLSKDDHKVTATGNVTIDVTGGTEADSHTLRIVNSGIATVGFSTYFLFPGGGVPTLPTANGAISLISFTVHRAGASGISTQLISGASVNFS